MKNASLIIALLIVAGCSGYNPRHTEISSVPDPAFRARGYTNVIVQVTHDDFVFRKQLEDRIVETMRTRITNAYSAALLMPPTREWSKEAIAETLNKYRVQAILVVDGFSSGFDSIYVSGKSIVKDKTISYTDTTNDGTAVDTEERTVSREFVEPHTTAMQWTDGSLTLLDVSTDSKAWIGSFHSIGYANIGSFYYDVSQAIMKELTAYKMVGEQ